ncbi:MAG: site-specific DNA-methyltransferase, partial [Gammaproteobacteria bacterium]|nr:site-specific DNA-methyltransferase [Gammaproteobacteria bacterium]
RESDARAAPYSVPYDGREVYLHWANKDQYYIKSSEYLSNYTFELNEAIKKEAERQKGQKKGKGTKVSEEISAEGSAGDKPLKVHFRIVDASEGEHGNIKAASDQKRFFIIHDENPAFVENGELIIQFQYCNDPEKTGQDGAWQQTRLQQAEDAIIAALKADKVTAKFQQALQLLAPTEKQKQRTILGKYLQKYAARNTMDYFIHKDLGSFMRRELDFYIKNEIMRLDDIENAEAPKVEQYLGKIRVLRRIAHQLITFLAQLEDFQKKLWLKKKFVTETNYCITLDRIPESFYAEIAANDKQREEWVKLFAIDEIVAPKEQDLLGTDIVPYSVPLSEEFLKANPFLLVDTVLFGEAFKQKLLAEIPDLDGQCDGVLMHSENFQALGVMQEKYREQVKCIYIDPPYNKGYDGFIYKDAYRHSSWLSMIGDRLSFKDQILSDDGVFSASIDDDEYSNLIRLMDDVCGRDNLIGNLIWDRNHSAQAGLFKIYHEYICNYAKNKSKLRITVSADGFIDAGAMKKPSKRHKLQEFTFPMGVKCEAPDGTEFRGRWGNAEFVEVISGRMLIKNNKTTEAVTLKAAWTQFGQMTRFFDPNKSADILDTKGQKIVDFYFSSTGKLKYRKERTFEIPSSVLRLGTASQSTNALFDVLGFSIDSTPKPVSLNEFLFNYYCEEGDFVLDYFAGSGTSGHAVINLNRQDDGERKYILVEQNNYFDAVLKPRIQKVIYSKDWKDGKPISREGISHCFKYLRLESYEDAVNNLVLKHDASRDAALGKNPAMQRDYLLNYFLDVETEGSQSLLNIADFRDPMVYQMKIKKPGSEESTLQNIDLIETFNWLIGLWVEHMAVPQ